MAISVTYTNYNGRIVAENRGETESLFMPDTLGNVIETRDMATGAKTSETTYWPYGEIRTQTGTNPSPFGFCGIWGYLQDTAARLYVRARYYHPNLSRWMTVDPLWPDEPAYEYSVSNPVLHIDPRGNGSISLALPLPFLPIVLPAFAPLSDAIHKLLATFASLVLGKLGLLAAILFVMEIRDCICKTLITLVRPIRDRMVKGRCSDKKPCLYNLHRFLVAGLSLILRQITESPFSSNSTGRHEDRGKITENAKNHKQSYADAARISCFRELPKLPPLLFPLPCYP